MALLQVPVVNCAFFTEVTYGNVSARPDEKRQVKNLVISLPSKENDALSKVHPSLSKVKVILHGLGMSHYGTSSTLRVPTASQHQE